MTPTQTADVSSILPGLAQGDRVAVAAAYGSFGGPVTTIAYGVLGDGDLAGRAVLSTFYRIAEATAKLVTGVDPSMLVYSLARSEVTDLWQHEIERRRADDGSAGADSLGAIALDATGSAWDVRRAIDQLAEDEQTLLKLVHFASMQPSAIIDHLGITVDDLKALSKRAHRELATNLSQIESGEDHSLDHVTSLLCSDAMWTATSDPMVDSIIAVLIAGPEALGPLPTAAPKPETPKLETPKPETPKPETPKSVSKKETVSLGADASVVRISPHADAADAAVPAVGPNDSVVHSERPALDLPWKTAESSPSSDPALRDNGSGTDASGTFSSATSPPGRVALTTAAPQSRNEDAATTARSEPPALSTLNETATGRRAHLPLPDPVSAQIAAVPGVAPSDASRLPAVLGAEGEPEPATKDGLRFRFSGSSLLAIAAIVVGLVMGIGALLSMRGNSGVVGTQVLTQLVGTERLPDASAWVTLSEAPAGVEVYLEFEQLGAAPENSFFQGWAQTTAGEQVPLGSFHLRRKESSGAAFVALWAGVDLQDLSEISVRLQEVGGPNEPSDQVLLSGPVFAPSTG